jgi:DNA-binding protein HU-beta
MNKGELIEKVLADKTAKIESKAQAERVVNAVLGALQNGLRKDKKVSVVGFGTFTVKKLGKRRVINPQTREKMWTKPSKTVRFKPGKSLKSSL